MPPDLILYMLIAAGLIFWLKSILGTRDDDEQGSNRSNNNDDALPPFMRSESNTEEQSNVIPLNVAVGDQFELPRHVRIDNKTTENALEEISKEHPSFDFNSFIQGAEFAFPMVIEAFAEGDRETLKNLLADNVYDGFEKAITAREEAGETVETDIRSIEKIDVQAINVKSDTIFITVRFVAKEVCVIRNKEGTVIAGDPEQQTEMNDIWVFGREIEAEGPEWLLYETRDGDVEEDHKTPLPESGKSDD